MSIQKFKMSVANTVINYKNSTISNVKDAGLVDLMKNLAETYQNEIEEDDDDSIPKSLAKKIKDAGMNQTWEENEYDEEFI